MDSTIRGLLLGTIIEDIGVYPKSHTDFEGRIRLRTSFEEGHNRCMLDISSRLSSLSKWREELKEDVRKAFDYLIKNEAIHASIRNNEVSVYINVNDVFCHGSDTHNLDVKDLPSIEAICRDFGYQGIVAFVANSRGVKPLPLSVSDGYKLALSTIKKQENSDEMAEALVRRAIAKLNTNTSVSIMTNVGVAREDEEYEGYATILIRSIPQHTDTYKFIYDVREHAAKTRGMADAAYEVSHVKANKYGYIHDAYFTIQRKHPC